MQSQNIGQQTPSNREQYDTTMEFSVENNIKEHFYGFKFLFLHHKTDTVNLSEPVTCITDVFNIPGGLKHTNIYLLTILYFKSRVKISSSYKESTWTLYLLILLPLLMQTECTKMDRVFIIIKLPSPQMTGAPLDAIFTLWVFWMTNPAMDSSAVRKHVTEKNTEYHKWVATILLHVRQAVGSNLGPETGYFGFFKGKNTCVKFNTRLQAIPYLSFQIHYLLMIIQLLNTVLNIWWCTTQNFM